MKKGRNRFVSYHLIQTKGEQFRNKDLKCKLTVIKKENGIKIKINVSNVGAVTLTVL